MEHVLKTLISFGLTQKESQVYIRLAKKGSHTGRNLCNALNMPKHQLYQCLRNLQNKGIVNSNRERPATFSAVPFEKALDLLVKAKLEEAQRAQQKTDEALCDWQSMLKENHMR